MKQASWMIFGAYGYTGALIAQVAVEQGLQPILAGRREEQLKPLAHSLKLPYKVVDTNNTEQLHAVLQTVEVVLNCAGPFKYTARPLAEACIKAGTHYLDLSGEVPEFTAVESLDTAAQAANIMLMPGVGFGVAPTDALAVLLKQALPTADQLTLTFEAIGGVSRGTLITVLSDLPEAGVLRCDGKMLPAYVGAKQHQVAYNGTTKQALLNPWRGDLFTAFVSTGIPNIETYAVFPGAMRVLARLRPFIAPLLRSQRFKRLLKRLTAGQAAGPSATERAQGKTLVWGEVRDRQQVQTAQIIGPEAYDYTALTALYCVKQILAGTWQAGFQTPALVFDPVALIKQPGVVLQAPVAEAVA